MKKLLLIIHLLIILIESVTAQKVVTGKVVNADDKTPLTGTTVIIKGTTTGVITDLNGEYKIEANIGDTLVFSFVGMQTELVEVTSNIINVSLAQNLKEVDEVVIVGYGVQKRKDLTGSVAVISGDELASQPSLSAASSIQGKVSGVQVINNGAPGSAPIIRIRGVGTILGGADPLYVVDGIITSDIRNINNNDIVSIDILKDASSAAIYGARAANGVVLITTKAGQKNGTTINYDSHLGIKIPENTVEMADAKLYAEYTNEALAYDNQPAAFDLANLPNANTNWFKEITRIAKLQNHSFSLNSGNENSTHYLGLGYLNEEGLMIDNSYKRLTARLNNKFNAVDNILTIGTNINISAYESLNAPLHAFNQAYRYSPTVRVKDVNGNYGYNLLTNVGNPMATINYYNDKSWGHRMLGNAFTEVNVTSGLQYKINVGVDKSENNGRNYVPEYYVSAIQRTETSSLTRNKNSHYSWIIDHIVTLDKDINQHQLKLMAGTTAEKRVFEELAGSRNDVPNKKNYWYLKLGDETMDANSHYGDKETRRSYIGRINYIFDEKYLLTANFRADGSSKFSKENRWGYFPSVSIGWRLSQERFIQNIDWIYSIKLKANWGQIGNDNIPSNAFLYTITSGLNYVFGKNQQVYQGATITEIKDPNLKWEVTIEKGIGLDYSLFEGKLSGIFEYYDKLAEDVLLNTRIDAIFGDTEILTNKAEIRNKGVEFSFKWSQKITGINFQTRFSGTYNKNTIENVYDALQIISGELDNGQVTTRTEEGKPVGSFWLWETDGVFNDQDEIDNYTDTEGNLIQPNAVPGDLKIKDNNKDGIINENDRIYAGSYQPGFYFGWNTDINYKAFDFSMIWYGNLGNKIYNGLKAQRWGNENIVASLKDRWTINNQTSNIPRASNDVPIASTYYLESGSFLRLNSVTLGYSLPVSLVNKLKIRRLRLYFTAQNPITFQKYSGFTSELPRGTLDSGIELNAYPTASTYLFGINVEF